MAKYFEYKEINYPQKVDKRKDTLCIKVAILCKKCYNKIA